VTHPAFKGWAFGRMDAEFGRGQSEDQPAITDVNVLEAERILEHVSQCFRFGRVEQGVCACDGHRTIVKSRLLLHDSVAKMGNDRRLDHFREFQRHVVKTHLIEQTDTTTEHQWSDVDLEFVEEPGLHELLSCVRAP
jgi:hypothetical protein